VFIFDGGVLQAVTIDSLTITADEISAFRFCSPDEARDLLRPYVWNRAIAALTAIDTDRPHYRHRDDQLS